MQTPISKSISNEWVWISKYGALKTNFYIAIPQGRCIEIGSGFAPNGIPRGGKKTLTESGLLSLFGFSSLYARVADYDGLCQISVFKDVDPNNLPRDFDF